MNLVKFYIDSFKGLSRDVWAIALIYLVNRSGEMVIPFMSLYITQDLGWSKNQAGIVLLCFGLGALMGSNIGGYFTDKIGNVKVMFWSLFFTGFAFIGILFFKTYLSLCLWMAVTGLCSSAFSPAAFGAVSIFGKPENLTRGYTLLRIAINLGIAIGPAIGGFLAYKVGFDWLFIVDGITCLIASIVVLLIFSHKISNKEEKLEQNQELSKSPYKDWKLMLFLFFNLLNMLAFFQILFSVPVYFREVFLMNEFWIGIFFTVNGLLLVLFEMPIVYIIEKKKWFFPALALGALMIGLGYLALGVCNTPLVAIILYSILVAFGEIFNFPVIPTMAIQRAGDKKNHGKYMGLVTMMFAMSFTLAPISGLPVVDITGFESYWLIAAVMSLLSSICLVILGRSFFESKEY